MHDLCLYFGTDNATGP
jgi:hypothetical protein